MTHDAIVLDRGTIVHAGPSAELLEKRELLERWLAVARS
jgi:branched-chain amino acid transport system ATP-binding protein